MMAAAPGKVLLSGAYAVLFGAPAIVCAVDRYARASSGPGFMTAEVAELGEPCTIDVHELQLDGRKLGLGSSAAALVAALALRAHRRGEAVGSPFVRGRIFEQARAVHARVQGGGSGVDVAASTFGGVLHFQRSRARQVELPAEVHISVFFSGVSARTSALIERVRAFARRDVQHYLERIAGLTAVATSAAEAIDASDGARFVAAVAAHLDELGALGTAADACIVLPAVTELAVAARSEGAAFVPSGAGGGDVAVFVGTTAPSVAFMKRADRLAMQHLALEIDHRGVRIEKRNG
jgi:phosphomevalonate kinase